MFVKDNYKYSSVIITNHSASLSSPPALFCRMAVFPPSTVSAAEMDGRARSVCVE